MSPTGPAHESLVVEELPWESGAVRSSIEAILKWGIDAPDAPALVQGTTTLSFGAMRSAILGAAEVLAQEHGVVKGSSVALMPRTDVDSVIAGLAAQAVGAVLVLIDPQTGPDELLVILSQCDVALVVAGPPEAAAKVVSVRVVAVGDIVRFDRGPSAEASTPLFVDQSWDAPAAVLNSSGTTGAPKSIRLSLRAVTANNHSVKTMLELTPNDVMVSPIQMGSAMAFVSTTMSALYAGSSVVLLPHFRPGDLCKLIDDHSVTTMLVVPAMLEMILSYEGRDQCSLSSLRGVWTGGAGVRVATTERFEAEFGVPVLGTFGMAELSVASLDLPSIRKPGSAGISAAGFEFAAANDDGQILPNGETGEIVGRGPTMMDLYIGQPELTAQTIDSNGWLHTGDLGHVDGDGHLWITGRKKDVIIRGGANVAPAHLEEIAVGHPGIASAAALGIPDDVLGERIRLCVVSMDPELTEETVLAHCRENLSSIYVPDQIRFVDAFPLGRTGKVQREELRLRTDKIEGSD